MIERATKSCRDDLEYVSTVRQVIYKWKAFGTMASLSRSGRPPNITARASRYLVGQARANPAVSSTVLQSSPVNLGVNVYTATVLRNLNVAGLHCRVPRKSTKKPDWSTLKLILMNCKHSGKMNLWVDGTKLEVFAKDEKRYIWRAPSEALEERDFMSIKYGGGSIPIWACFAVSETGKREIIDGTMDSAKEQTIVNENVLPSTRKLGLGRDWLFQRQWSKPSKQFTRHRIYRHLYLSSSW